MRIPYLTDWTVSYKVKNASGTVLTPSACTCAVTNANGSAVTLSASATWEASSSSTIQSFTNAEVNSSAYGTRWTLTWTGTASGVDFTDVEYAYIVKADELDALTTVYSVKNLLGVTDTTDDDDISWYILMATQTLNQTYDTITFPKVTETRYYYTDNTLVLLDECVSITSITDQSGTVLDTDDYTVLYRRDDTIKGFLLESADSGRLSVLGEWGYDDVPFDIERACAITAATWYKRAKLGDANDIIGGFSTLARETRDIMEARRRASI